MTNDRYMLTFGCNRAIIKNMGKDIENKAEIEVSGDEIEIIPPDSNAVEIDVDAIKKEEKKAKKKSAPMAGAGGSAKNEMVQDPEAIAKKRRDKMMRIYTGAAIIVGLALSFLLRELTVYLFDVVLLVVLFLGTTEIMKAKDVRKREVKEYFVYGYLICAYLVFFMGTIFDPAFGLIAHIIAQLVVFFTWALYTFLMQYVDKPFIRQCKLKKVPLGVACRKVMREYFKIIVYPVLLLFSLFAINHLGTAHYGSVNLGLFGLLLVFVISCFTDTFAYATGSVLKGPKLLPEKLRYISPNKTITGSVGGIIGAWVGTLLLVFVVFGSSTYFSDFMSSIGINATQGLIIFSIVGILGSIVTQIGDLYASWLKRKTGIKDFGNYLPGHGGVMDRLDGVAFNSVFIFISMLIIFII